MGGVQKTWGQQQWGDFQYGVHMERTNTVTITGYTGAGGDVVVPAQIEGLPVVEIGDSAFDHCSGLSSISLPDSVERTGWMAFGWCRSLSKVSLGSGLVEVGDSAFYGCFELPAITIPSSVERIGWGAFQWCFSLTNATLGNSWVEIGDSAFPIARDGLPSISPRALRTSGKWRFPLARQ